MTDQSEKTPNKKIQRQWKDQLSSAQATTLHQPAADMRLSSSYQDFCNWYV